MQDNLYDIHFNVQKHHWWFVVKERIVRDMIGKCQLPAPPLDILDAGCGPGLMLEGLKGFGNVYGMDFSEKAVQYSQSKNIGDIRRGELPDRFAFKDKRFDLILALDVIEHIEDDVESLRVLHRALKPHGKIILTAPAFPFLWSRHDEVNEHKRRYTLPEFRAKIVKASFDVQIISYYNTFLFIPVAVVRVLRRVLKVESASDLKIPPSAVNALLKGVFMMERALLKRDFRFPFGVSVIAVASKK